MLARVLGSALLGAASALAYPPYDQWWVAPLTIAGFTLLLRDVGWRSGLVIGYVHGLAFFVLLLTWMDVIGVDAWLGLSAFLALYQAGLGAAITLLLRLRWWPLWVALAWVLAEWVRGRFPLGGFSWGRLAYAQADSTFTPYAALVGAPGVTLAVASCGTALAAAVVLTGRRRLAAAGAAVVVAACGLLVPLPVGGPPVTAAVIQGNVPRLGLDFLGQREEVLRNHVAETERLAADVAAGEEPQPDLVIWPENASDIDPYRNESAGELIQGAVEEIGAPTLVGAVVRVEDGQPVQVRLENTSIVWDPVTGPGETYVKRRPVPFGEYVPFRSWLANWISRFDRVARDFRAGDEPGVLDLAGVPVGVVICFEVADDGVVRDAIVGGGELLVVQTNNATYGRTPQPEQQLAITRLRSVEHGRATLVAATSGISAVIAPDGTVEQRSAEFVATSLVSEVSRRDALTLADRLGPWPERAAVIVVVVALVAAARHRGSDDRSHREENQVAA